MIAVRKKIVTNANDQPVEVVIDYEDWLKIERLLDIQQEQEDEPPLLTDLAEFRGTMTITEDPVAYQRRIRDEWT